jgi:RHS repeat-associated protein
MVNHVYLNGVRIAAVAPSGSASYYHTDQVDSVKVVTDDSGKAVQKFEYLPYGETWFEEHVGGTLEEHSPKFNSQELDKETSFYYFNARHYDPAVARFVTADKIIDGEMSTQGWNRYMYVHGNPVMYKDPTGHNVFVLKCETGAGGRGHTADLVQIREGQYKGKWMYVSKNGVTEEGQLPGKMEQSHYKTPDGKIDTAEWSNNTRHRNKEQVFDSPEAFMKNQKLMVDKYNALIKSGMSDKEIREDKKNKNIVEFVTPEGKARYEEGFEIKTTEKQDIDILKRQQKANREQYGIIMNNCNDLVDDSLDKHTWTPDTSLNPNSWYKDIKNHYRETYKKEDPGFFDKHNLKAENY